MADDLPTTTVKAHDKSKTAMALGALAVLLSIVALVVAVQAYSMAKEAVEEANRATTGARNLRLNQP